MQKYFSNRIILAILFFVIGGMSDLALNQFIEKRKSRHTLNQVDDGEQSKMFFDQLYGPDFFGQSKNPFAEMRRLQAQLLNPFYTDDQFKDNFDFWYQNKFGGTVADIKQSEDEQNIEYDIEFAQPPKTLKVEIKNDQVNIYEESDIQSIEKGAEKTFKSTFLRSFPAPAGVNAEKYTVEQSDKHIRIKFPKIKN